MCYRTVCGLENRITWSRHCLWDTDQLVVHSSDPDSVCALYNSCSLSKWSQLIQRLEQRTVDKTAGNLCWIQTKYRKNTKLEHYIDISQITRNIYYVVAISNNISELQLLKAHINWTQNLTGHVSMAFIKVYLRHLCFNLIKYFSVYFEKLVKVRISVIV